MENKKCFYCGNTKDMNPDEYIEGHIKTLMITFDCCFSCSFWIEKIKQYTSDTFIINHERCVGSTIDKEKVPFGAFIGSGGRDFYVMYIDERKGFDEIFKHYNNVWNQGIVPEIFYNEPKLKDNAIHLSEKLYNEILDIWSNYQKAIPDLEIRYVTKDSYFPDKKIIEFSFSYKKRYKTYQIFHKSNLHKFLCDKQLEYGNLLVYSDLVLDTELGICTVKLFINEKINERKIEE